MGYSLSEPGRAVAAEIDMWLQRYIGRPHARLGREGPICPFVIPSLRSGALTVRVHQWQGPDNADHMVKLIERIVVEFEEDAARTPRPPKLRALLVAITAMPESAWGLIDEGHRRAKGFVIDRGLMLGQFHPKCDEPAVHNPVFPVNRSPYPMFAIRNMALHDLLFVHHDPLWFARYCETFAHKFDEDATSESYLHELFRTTMARYSSSEGIGS